MASLKPKEDTVAARSVIRIADRPVVVINLEST